MLQPWRTATVIKIENETAYTKKFWLQVKGESVFNFKSGQFVTLDLPIHEQKNKRWRSYSIASAPNNTNVFELIVVLMQDGLGTNYLFNELVVGSEISFRGPNGKFILPENIDRDLFLICTGTGVAPFRAMIKHIYQQNLPHKNVHLFFGCRTFSDTLYQQEFENLNKKEKTFYYHPVFSRENNVEENQYKGYVHDVYEKFAKKNSSIYFYLCGWKDMIDEAKERIINLGFKKEDLHLELYG